jgi:dihydroorotase
MQQITITTPDDWHLHFRDGDMLGETVPATARCFARAIVMPNLVPPVVNAKLAMEYKARILKARPQGSNFEPLMTLFLTNQTTKQDIIDAKNSGVIAVKFDEMQKQGLLLLVHGEVTDNHVDIFDREKVFIDQYMAKIVQTFPELKVVFEHITTSDAADFVSAGAGNLAATITPQHLLLNRNDLLVGGIKPHNYCLPVLKRSTHQQALRKVVASGSDKFFLGTDSAPHAKHAKENACGCAGCYSAWSALELYTQVFDELAALDKLEGFASFHGADFYGLPRNSNKVTLVKQSWTVPEAVIMPDGEAMVPFFAGQTVNWKIS